jgi:DNA-binding response OmpR family regulator
MQMDQGEKPLVLVIEDNPDMRQYIRDNMQDCYRLIEADNGLQGLEHVRKEIPDLIISDIMMPKMDGFEMCKKIKNDIHTSHIPLILLTARAEIGDKLRGLESGADDYIAKPFVIDELNMRVKNLIEQRRKLRERFSREALFGMNDSSFTQHDRKFLQQAMTLIEGHIDDPHFTVERLGEAIGMSRMTLHSKLKALTNQSPHHFIRLLRLKKAAVLLQQKTVNVTEVAYEVGFKDLSHFAKVFKEQFGETPSQFCARHKI